MSGDYVSDQLGRVIVTPGVDTATGTRLVTGYYTDDTVKGTATATVDDTGQETGWITRSYTRDPIGRTNTWTDGTLPAAAAKATAEQLTEAPAADAAGQPDYIQHYSTDSDSPTWAETPTGGIDLWLPSPDGTIAANLTTDQDNPGDVTVTDLHGDATTTIPVPGGSAAGQASAQPSFQSFDAFGAPTSTSQTALAASSDVNGSGSSYGYLYNDQRSRQHTSGLILMGARLYNPGTGTFTTPDPIPGGNPNPYTYPPDPVNDADPTGADTKGSAFWQALACLKIGPLQCAKAAEVTRLGSDFFSNDVRGSDNFMNAGRHFVWNVVLIGIIGKRDAKIWVSYHERHDFETDDSKRDRLNDRLTRARCIEYAYALTGDSRNRARQAFDRFIRMWRARSYGGFTCVTSGAKVRKCNRRNQADVNPKGS